MPGRRRIAYQHGLDEKAWPPVIKPSHVHEYIGMSKASWHQRYKKDWNADAMMNYEMTGYPRDIVKMWQNRWVGSIAPLVDMSQKGDSTMTRYLAHQIEEIVKAEVEVAVHKVIASMTPRLLSVAMKVANQQLTFDEMKPFMENQGLGPNLKKSGQISIERMRELMRRGAYDPNKHARPQPKPDPSIPPSHPDLLPPADPNPNEFSPGYDPDYSNPDDPTLDDDLNAMLDQFEDVE